MTNISDALRHERSNRPAHPAAVDMICVQSQVIYGAAGNSAAVPPLHSLGIRVAEVPTTLLSNAPCYPTTTGKVLSAEFFADLLKGVSDRGLPSRAKALVSGYMGSSANGEVFAKWIKQTLANNPDLLFCLDPVMGDTHTGMYVEAELKPIFQHELLPLAHILLPNAFELEEITEMEVQTIDQGLVAARKVIEKGPKLVVVGSLQGMREDRIATIAVDAHNAWVVEAPRLDIDVSGSGDILTALFVAFYLENKQPAKALEQAIAAIYQGLLETKKRNEEELDVSIVGRYIDQEIAPFLAHKLEEK